jgi:hypothetical protein
VGPLPCCFPLLQEYWEGDLPLALASLLIQHLLHSLQPVVPCQVSGLEVGEGLEVVAGLLLLLPYWQHPACQV